MTIQAPETERKTRTAAARPLTSRSPAGEVVRAYLGAQAARLRSLDPDVRRDAPDAVHQMRVTARRLRAALQAFPMVLPETDRLREELRWLGQALGHARDSEMLSEYLRARLASTPVELVLGPAEARVTAHFAPRTAAARRAVLEALDSPRYLALTGELSRLLSERPRAGAATEAADEVLLPAVARTYRRARRRMAWARQTPSGPARDVALHEARKAAKRARYAAEAAAPAFGQPARRFARRMKAVQSVLGEHQDDVTAHAMAREVGVHAHLAGENAFTFGLLAERAHRDSRQHQRKARKAWKRATRRQALRWLS